MGESKRSLKTHLSNCIYNLAAIMINPIYVSCILPGLCSMIHKTLPTTQHSITYRWYQLFFLQHRQDGFHSTQSMFCSLKLSHEYNK